MDWTIYCRITSGACDTIPALSEVTGYPETVVAASVERLVNYLLITHTNGTIRALGLQEMLTACQIRYSPDMPVVIENGVIKQKDRE